MNVVTKNRFDCLGTNEGDINRGERIVSQGNQTQEKTAHNAVIEGKILSLEQTSDLCKSFTVEDVRAALWSIEDDKAPGPDGFSSKFYKASWDIVKNEICEVVLSFFNHVRLLKQVNNTLLTMVSKDEDDVFVSQYRHIACCNVIYKIISKLLCLRLKTILPGLISENQGAFVEGQSILDNILVCQDMLKNYNNRRKAPRCTVKVDLRKTYDSVHALFVGWVMECISTPSYSIMINGGLHGFFKGERGIRQEDPISSLLFVLVIEYLSKLLRKVSGLRDYKFHQGCKHLGLTHLVFADDLMLFSHGDKKSFSLLIRALKTFEKVSKLVSNSNKTVVYF
uniref:Reverse transcriptase domain-containing protein n=1 Tax=Chenopodium quinoa TaxID=63459 RepID=A0A803N4X6_CHEQI